MKTTQSVSLSKHSRRKPTRKPSCNKPPSLFSPANKSLTNPHLSSSLKDHFQLGLCGAATRSPATRIRMLFPFFFLSFSKPNRNQGMKSKLKSLYVNVAAKHDGEYSSWHMISIFWMGGMREKLHCHAEATSAVKIGHVMLTWRWKRFDKMVRMVTLFAACTSPICYVLYICQSY